MSASKTPVWADDAAIQRSRRLGLGMVLGLPVGTNDPEMHLSLVYLNNVGSDYERNLCKEIAENFFVEQLGFPSTKTVDLVLGDKCYERSVEVKGEIVEIQKQLELHFATSYPKFAVAKNSKLHIDLRDSNKNGSGVRTQGVPLFGNFF